MKTNWMATAILLLLVMSLGSMSAAQQAKSKPAPSKDNGPSLDETITWLKDKILKFGGFSYVYRDPAFPNSQQRVLSYTDAKLDGCEWEMTARDSGSGQFIEDTFSLKLQELNSKAIVVSGIGGLLSSSTIIRGDHEFFDVLVTTEGNKEVIVWHGTSNGKTSKYELAFTDMEIADRVAKAVSHAITLCKANPEPF
jgi:hypothetical protein